MQTRNSERNLTDLRSLTEALARAAHDSGQSLAQIAEHIGVSRGYLTDALNVERAEVLQFQARLLVPFCREVGVLPLAYIADQLGYVLVPRHQAGTADTLVREVLDVQAAAGRLAGAARRVEHGAACPATRSDLLESARQVQREAAEAERAAEALSFTGLRARA